MGRRPVGRPALQRKWNRPSEGSAGSNRYATRCAQIHRSFGIAFFQQVFHPETDLPEVGDGLLGVVQGVQIAGRAELGGEGGQSRAGGFLVRENGIPPKQVPIEGVLGFGCGGVGDLRTFFIADAGVDVDGVGKGQLDGFFVVVEEGFADAAPVGEIGAELEGGEFFEQSGGGPGGEHGAAAVGFVADGDVVSGLGLECGIVKAALIVEGEGVARGVNGEFDGIGIDGAREKFIEGLDVFGGGFPGGKEHADELQLVFFE